MMNAIAPRPTHRTSSATQVISVLSRSGVRTSAAAGSSCGAERCKKPRSGAALIAGRYVGSYYLIEALGAGGQADVWRARRGGPNGHEVALKIVIGGASCNGRRAARLRREADRGARLRHPALVCAHEFGVTERFVFLAMTLVEGVPLDQVIALRRSGMPSVANNHWLASLPRPNYVGYVTSGVAQIARALHMAHEAGVAHRDVKPANILIGNDPKSQWVYLVDFGMGRDLDVATHQQMRDWSGSPLYMAPEKLRGCHEDEKLCDQFSLGTTLYEALTLERAQDVPVGLSLTAIWAHLANTAYVAPRFPREAGLSLELEIIVRKAVAAQPEHRFESALAFGEALESYLHAESEPSGSQGATHRRRCS